jgi:hypothetical protein
MTSQGSASGRFSPRYRAAQPVAAEVALREMGNQSLMLALDYVILLAALTAMCAGNWDAIDVLRRLLRKVRPRLCVPGREPD